MFLKGEQREAEKLFMQSHKLYKRLFGHFHEKTAKSHHNLVKIFYEKENYEAAWEEYMKAFEIYNQFYNIEFYDTDTEEGYKQWITFNLKKEEDRGQFTTLLAEFEHY